MPSDHVRVRRWSQHKNRSPAHALPDVRWQQRAIRPQKCRTAIRFGPQRIATRIRRYHLRLGQRALHYGESVKRGSLLPIGYPFNVVVPLSNAVERREPKPKSVAKCDFVYVLTCVNITPKTQSLKDRGRPSEQVPTLYLYNR